MRLLRLLFLLALLIGVSAAAYSLLGGDGPFRREIGITSDETRQTGDGEGFREEAAPRYESVPQPQFDIIRVEETGEIVAAGTAPPGWLISIETDTGPIGKVTAEFDGSWVWTPDTPLPAGEYSLGLRARAPDGAREIVASQRVAVSVSRKRETAVVALSEDDKPTRVLQSGVATAKPAPHNRGTDDGAAKTSREVAFSAVDYTDRQETGQLSMSGVATPGARMAFYLDNRFIGSAQADADGTWQFSLSDMLGGGEHVLRADHVDMASGKVLSRAEVRFDPSGMAIGDAPPVETRTALSEGKEPAPAERDERVAARPESAALSHMRVERGAGDPELSSAPRAHVERAAPPAQTAGRIEPSTRLARERETGIATDQSSEATEASRPRASAPQPRTAIVVRRGDTLWHIAEQHYGSGMKYTQIFRTNRDQIRNPHRIYPGQRFDLPK